MATNGLVVMTPASIAYSGTSASINADGSVAFSAVTSLSLNGVFTSDYDNYMMTVRFTASSSRFSLFRLRSSGSDASGSNYTYQYLYADGTSVTAGRNTSETSSYLLASNATQRCGVTTNIYGPFLSQPTAFRAITANDLSSARITDVAGTHSLSTSYDGFTIFTGNTVTLTGLLTVFGFNQ